MLREMRKAQAILQDRQAGWVHRRDAAELLGRIAADALAVLHLMRAEDDPDVQRVIGDALTHARGGLDGVHTVSDGPTLADLAKACAKEGERTVTATGNGFEIDVQMSTGRHQRVYLDLFQRKDGMELVRVQTYCGRQPDADVLAWSMRSNAKLVQCALALAFVDGEERLVLLNNFILSETTAFEIKAAVKEIAFYGDWLEKKLSGLDDF